MARAFAVCRSVSLIIFILLAACGGAAPQASPTITPDEVLAETTTAPEATPTPEPTAIPTPIPTEVPTEVPTIAPTSTPEPTAEPTATTIPTPEMVLAEGEVVFETTLGEEVIRAAVPEQVAPILEKAGTEPGQVEEVEKAVWKVKEDEILLGKVPVFVKDGDGWRYNAEQVVYEENYINLGPALVLPNTKSFSIPELTEWPPAGVFVQNHSGFDTIGISGQLAGGEISEVVLLSRGSTIETQRAYLEFKFKNPNTSRVTSFWMTAHDSVWIENVRQPFARLSSVRGAQVGSILTSSTSEPFNIQMVGSELSDADINAVRATILAGGVLDSDDGYYLAVGFGKY